MALIKDVELQNGMVVSFHRIVSLNIITCVQNTIEVASYTKKEKRDEEVSALSSGGEFDVFTETMYFTAPYDSSMSVRDAYLYLKDNEPVFDGAQDA